MLRSLSEVSVRMGRCRDALDFADRAVRIAEEASLSPRESAVLRLVAEGLTNRAIATRLRIGEATVKTHLLHVYGKLGVSDRASAVNAAWQRGLVQSESSES